MSDYVWFDEVNNIPFDYPPCIGPPTSSLRDDAISYAYWRRKPRIPRRRKRRTYKNSGLSLWRR